MPVGYRHLAPDQRIKQRTEDYQREPMTKLFSDIQIAVATECGGDYLRYLQAQRGFIWADPAVEPTVRTPQEAAEVIGLPVSEVDILRRRLLQEALGRLRKTPEWQDWVQAMNRKPRLLPPDESKP